MVVWFCCKFKTKEYSGSHLQIDLIFCAVGLMQQKMEKVKLFFDYFSEFKE